MNITSKKSKLVSVILSSTLAFSGIGVFSVPTASAAEPTLVTTVNSGNITRVTADHSSNDLQFVSQNIDAINKINPYLALGEDGKLHIDNAAKDIVSQEVYDYVLNGVNIVNEGIDSGRVVLDPTTKQLVPVSSTSANIQDRSLISPSGFSNTYAWGYAVTMNQSETKELAHVLDQIADGFMTVATASGLIAGMTGAAPALAAAVAALIVSAGARAVSKSLTNRNNPKGVTLNLHWAPVYYEVTTN